MYEGDGDGRWEMREEGGGRRQGRGKEMEGEVRREAGGEERRWRGR